MPPVPQGIGGFYFSFRRPLTKFRHIVYNTRRICKPSPVTTGDTRKETMKDKFYVALDFETFYIKKKYSVGGTDGMTIRQYCEDGRFDPYLVSFAVKTSDAEKFGVSVDGWETVEYTTPGGEKAEIKAIAMHPDDAKWSEFDGATFIIHNANFDCEVLNALIRSGKVPKIEYDAVDTADLVAYLGVRRSLKDAMKHLYGIEISKEVRSSMDGKHVSDLNAQERSDLYRYGTDDSIHCYMLWDGYGEQWPYVERMMSKMNRDANIRGIDVDVELVETGLETLRKIRSTAEAKIPWVNDPDPESRFPAASLPALAKWLSLRGYPVPKSFNKNGNEFMDWKKTLDAEKDRELLDILDARIAVTGTNSHIARLELMLKQMGSDRRLHPGFVYFGAHTGRFTAGVSYENENVIKSDADKVKNLNLLNMTKKPVYGVDMRAMYIAGAGKKLVVADYSQVEARALLWLADDTEMCEALMNGKANLYQLTAVKMGWCKPEDDIKHNDPLLYQMAKQCVLGLGYSMSTFTFALRLEAAGITLKCVPRSEWTETDVERIRFVCEKQAFLSLTNKGDEHRIGQLIWVQRIVEQWRDANWRIAGRRNEETGFREGGFWREMQSQLIRAAVSRSPRFWFDFPSGRRKVYHDPVVCQKSDLGGRMNKYYMARPVLGGRSTILNGGKLTENTVQAFCRDILVNSIVEIHDKHPGWEYLFNVYDEVVFCVPEDEADFALKEVSDIMCHGDYISEWTKGLPLGVEGCVTDYYTK